MAPCHHTPRLASLLRFIGVTSASEGPFHAIGVRLVVPPGWIGGVLNVGAEGVVRLLGNGGGVATLGLVNDVELRGIQCSGCGGAETLLGQLDIVDDYGGGGIGTGMEDRVGEITVLDHPGVLAGQYPLNDGGSGAVARRTL